MRQQLAFLLALGVVGAAVVAAACGTTANGLADPNEADGAAVAPGPSDGGDVGVETDGINTTGVGAGTGAATGLPCDVQQLLENRCIGCHLAGTA